VNPMFALTFPSTCSTAIVIKSFVRMNMFKFRKKLQNTKEK
jgi:hypothetical protein